MNAVGASWPATVVDELELWVVGEYLGFNDLASTTEGGRKVTTKAQFEADAKARIRERVERQRAEHARRMAQESEAPVS